MGKVRRGGARKGRGEKKKKCGKAGKGRGKEREVGSKEGIRKDGEGSGRKRSDRK